MSEAPKRKRLLIDPSTQLRVLAFVALLLAVSLALAFLTVDQGLKDAAERTGRIFIPVDWAREVLRGPFLFSSVLILLGGSVLALVWSHRFVGPVLVLTAGIRRIREGDLSAPVRVRDGDALRDTVDDFAGMQNALRKEIGLDRERIVELRQRVAALAERLGGGAAERRELESIGSELERLTSFFQL